MIEYFQAGFTSAKLALEIAQGIVSLNTEAEKNQAIIDIQRHVIDAQRALTLAEQNHATTLKRIDSLEAEIVSLKTWDAQAEGYELADAGNGALAYRKKPPVPEGEPPHWLCPTCYEDRKKSYLQPERHPGMTESLTCPRCMTRLIVRGRPDNIVERSVVTRRPGGGR
jgi:hypothetical protein